MKALIDGVVIAEAPDDTLVRIEGNWYFPPESVVPGLLTESSTPYTCPWKGACQYFTANVGGAEHRDAAWSYPELRPGAVERVGTDFAGYLAFSPGVEFAS